jgi:probable HAF family extracellular repeat protein
MLNKTVLSVGIASCILALSPSAQAAALYTVAEIGSTLSSVTPDNVTNCGVAINRNGQVVVQHSSSRSLKGATLSSVISTGGLYTSIQAPGTQVFTSTYFTDINNTGHVVGNTDVPRLAFLGNTKQYTVLGKVSVDANVNGINDKDQAVGVTTVKGNSHAFVAGNKAMKLKDLGTLGGTFSSAADINNMGQVVGTSTTLDGSTHAFIIIKGQMKDLGTLPGAYTSRANAINDRGQVVGSSTFPTFTPTGHAFVTVNGVMTDLGSLTATSNSIAFDINNKGQIVGTNIDSGIQHGTPQSDPDIRAFATVKGKMQDLNGLIPLNSQWKLTTANAINDKGQITGCGINPTGSQGAFVLSPVRYNNGKLGN